MLRRIAITQVCEKKNYGRVETRRKNENNTRANQKNPKIDGRLLVPNKVKNVGGERAGCAWKNLSDRIKRNMRGRSHMVKNNNR